MQHDSADAMATHVALCQMSDDPEQWRRPPFAGIYGACIQAKYGTDGDGRDFLDSSACPF
jgi:hypothetical protein